MKAIVIVALLALSFTTGFTCSKNQPEQTEATPAAATTEAVAPAEGQPATEAAPAAPAAPAADAAATPAAETK